MSITPKKHKLYKKILRIWFLFRSKGKKVNRKLYNIFLKYIKYC